MRSALAGLVKANRSLRFAGSAYTYGYATLGEIFAWIIGWDLILEYAFGASTVASGWSSTLVAFLQDYGVNLPPQICDVPGAVWVMYHDQWRPLITIQSLLQQQGIDPNSLQHATAVFDLLAFLAIAGVTTVLVDWRQRSQPISIPAWFW